MYLSFKKVLCSTDSNIFNRDLSKFGQAAESTFLDQFPGIGLAKYEQELCSYGRY